MDLENQRRVQEAADRYGRENLVVLLGGAEPETVGIWAETVISGDPTYTGPLAGVPLGLRVYHIMEPEVKSVVDPAIYDAQVGLMEMVLDVNGIQHTLREKRRRSTQGGMPQ